MIRWASPAAALAIDTASARRWSPSATVAAAKYAQARARLSATYMSTSLCLMAWNEPMGTPNCSRPLAYSSVMSKIVWQVPTISRASAAVASSITAASSTGPTGSVAPTVTCARGRLLSSVSSGWTLGVHGEMQFAVADESDSIGRPHDEAIDDQRPGEFACGDLRQQPKGAGGPQRGRQLGQRRQERPRRHDPAQLLDHHGQVDERHARARRRPRGSSAPASPARPSASTAAPTRRRARRWWCTPSRARRAPTPAAPPARR